jgi:trigger factor
LALVEGCKHELELLIPAQAVEAETTKVTDQFRQKAHLKGFRAGKAPLSLIRSSYRSEIRQKVLENLVPRFFDAKVAEEKLRIVGQPNIKDVHFHDGADVHFKAEFEVFPEFEIGEYRGLEVPYADPEIPAEDVDKRVEEIRESKATYVNVDPRPLESGDYAVVSLESTAGSDEPIKSDEVQILIGGAETLPGFTENLTGASPGDVKEVQVSYPADYGSPKLAGKTVTFQVTVNGLRKKELPELNDEFAQDLGDFRTVDELREAVKKSIFAQRQSDVVRTAKDKLVDKLVDAHDFPVPNVFVERQIENRVEQRLRALAQEGVDPRSFNLDWNKIKEAQRDQATREVRASLLLGKVAEKEAIVATNEEVDKEVDRIARQEREMAAVVRKKMLEDGTLDRIASHIQTEKTLNFLFDNATKTVPTAADLAADAAAEAEAETVAE